MELEKAIAAAEEIAKTGTTEQKNAFVTWACQGIGYLSAQVAHGCGNAETREALKAVKAQYNAYLNAFKK